MTLKELLSEYDGEISVDVKKLTDDGISDAITFKNTEVESIKDTLLGATVSHFTVNVTDKLPAKATLEVTVKEAAVTP